MLSWFKSIIRAKIAQNSHQNAPFMTIFFFLDTDSLLIDKVWAKTTYSAFLLFWHGRWLLGKQLLVARDCLPTPRQVDKGRAGTRRQEPEESTEKIKVAPIHEGPNSESPVRAFMSRASLPILIKTACEKKGRMKRYPLCKLSESEGLLQSPYPHNTAYMTYNVSR